MATYTAVIDGGEGGETEIQAATHNEAWDLAVEWVRDGDWDTSEGTCYCTLSVTDHDVECPSEMRKTVAIDQPEPKCKSDEGEHRWRSPKWLGGLEENPGVWGHGGGVVITEVCMRCGCGRHTDTWAQDRTSGRQGLHEVTYQPGEFSEEIAERARTAEVAS